MTIEKIVSLVAHRKKSPDNEIEVDRYDAIVGARVLSKSGKEGYCVMDSLKVKGEEIDDFRGRYCDYKFVGVLSSNDAFTRFIGLPAATPENIERMIGYEAQQNVPFPMDQVLWNYKIIRGDHSILEKGELEVVLFAVKKYIVDNLYPFAKDMISVPVDGIPKLYKERLKECKRDVLIVDDDGERVTTLVSPFKGELKFSTCIALSIDTPPRGEEEKANLEAYKNNQAARLKAEITRSVTFMRTNMGINPPDEYWFTRKETATRMKRKLEQNGAVVKFESPSAELESSISRDNGLTSGLAGLVSWPNGVNLMPVPKSDYEEAEIAVGNVIKKFGGAVVSLGEFLEELGDDFPDWIEEQRRRISKLRN